MSSSTARAFWITGPCQSEIRTESLPVPAAGELEIETAFSAISRGTEALVYTGKVPASEYLRMRAPHQSGDFPGPVKYGYCSVGKVVGGDAGLAGRHVFCLYPHQTRYVVPASAVTLLPEELPPQRAVLTANLETAVNGVWDAAPRPGDRIAVIGAGTVGCLVAWLVASLRGTEVELIDIDPAKREIADALGIPFATPDSATRDADLILEASGNAGGLNLALELAGFEARIVELSWFGSEPVALPLGEAFHSKRLHLVSSQVAYVAASQRSRWDHARRLQLVLRLLADPILDRLISSESAFDTLPSLMRRITGDSPGMLCHRITYA